MAEQQIEVNISNAQLKELDASYIEVIPSPGAGKYIDVINVWTTISGDDHPNTDNVPLDDASPSDVNKWAVYALLYIEDETAVNPLYYGEITSLQRYGLGGLLRTDPGTFGSRVGGQSYRDNTPLMVGVVYDGSLRGGVGDSNVYTEQAYDNFIAPVNDKSISITIRYSILLTADATDPAIDENQIEVNISNAQLRESDVTYIEMIPAPGAGNYIDLVGIWLTINGDDQPNIDNVPPGIANPQQVNTWSSFRLLYIEDPTAERPLFSGEFTNIFGYGLGNLLRADAGTFGERIGSQSYRYNSALVMGVSYYGSLRSSEDDVYSESAFDDFIDPVTDKSLDFTLRYRILSATADSDVTVGDATLALGLTTGDVDDFINAFVLLTEKTDDPFTLPGDADTGTPPLSLRLAFPAPSTSDGWFAFWLPQSAGIPTDVKIILSDGRTIAISVAGFTGPDEYEYESTMGRLWVFPDILPANTFDDSSLQVTLAEAYPDVVTPDTPDTPDSSNLLIVEDGTGLPDSNSYVDVDFANAYFTARTLSNRWKGNTEKKAGRLIIAAAWLNGGFVWRGDILVPTQAMSWPRTGKDAEGRTLMGVPEVVKFAQCEVALHYSEGTLTNTFNQHGVVEEIRVGPITQKFRVTDSSTTITGGLSETTEFTYIKKTFG